MFLHCDWDLLHRLMGSSVFSGLLLTNNKTNEHHSIRNKPSLGGSSSHIAFHFAPAGLELNSKYTVSHRGKKIPRALV